MRDLLYAVLICSLLFAVSAEADEVFLRNGDRLSGTMVRLTEGKLVLTSDVAGEVTVNMADIQTFSTNGPMEVHLKDGVVLHQRITAGQAGQFGIETGETLQAQMFQLADVVSINPPAKREPKWTGSLSAGLTATTGNTSTEAFNASFAVARRGARDRATAGADFAKGRQKVGGVKTTTEDWWRVKAQYDYFISKKFFAFVNGRYEKDAIALLDRRVVLGGGGGYQWIESEKTNFATTAGLASLYEKFSNQLNSTSELSLQLGYNFDTQLSKNVKFLHDVAYFPALDQFSDYYLTATAEVRASLVGTMFANFKTIFNFDKTPAVGQSDTDIKYIVGVGATF